MSDVYTPGRTGGNIITPGSGSGGSIADSDISRVLPRQLSSGSTRGTQIVGYGSVKIDGSNNRIVLSANDTTITIGDTSNDDTTTGIALSDSDNNTLISLGKSGGTSPTTGLLVYDDTNTRRLLGGVYPNGTVKIALSQPGQDVATAPDNKLIWSSDFNSFKIIQTGVITVSHAANTISAVNTAPHPFKVTPSHIAFNDDGSRSVQLPITDIDTTTGNVELYQYISATTSLVVIQMLVPQNSIYYPIAFQQTYRYYLLQETASTT